MCAHGLRDHAHTHTHIQPIFDGIAYVCSSGALSVDSIYVLCVSDARNVSCGNDDVIHAIPARCNVSSH